MTFRSSPTIHIQTISVERCVERIFLRISVACGLVVSNVARADAEICEEVVESLSIVTECNCAVVREVLLDKEVSVESAHLLDSENADAAERLSSNRENLTFCNISSDLAVRCGLQSVECDIAGSDVALECTVCNLYRKSSCHDHLVLHLACSKLLGACVTAVEAHECICELVIELACDGLIVHIMRYGVVDVEESNDIFRDNISEVLREAAIDINFAGYIHGLPLR